MSQHLTRETLETTTPSRLSPDKTVKATTEYEDITDISKPRILIVEDSVDNQILLTAFLAKLPVITEVATNGQKAIELALQRKYDVILMDIQMPIMDGFEALQILRKHHYPGKVIALTAHAMNGDREACLAKGFDDYLCKPILKNSLFESISRHLI